MINIQKYYSVHISFILSILSFSIKFVSIQSNSTHSLLFYPLQPNSVYIGPIMSTLV